MRRILKKIFTISLVLSPVLSQYGIWISTITVFDAIIIILLSAMIIADVKDGKLEKANTLLEMIPFLVYIILQYLILTILAYNTSQAIDIGMRTLRYCTYLVVIIFYTAKYFDYSLGKKVFKFFVIFATLYYFLQLALMKTTGYYLKGYVPFLDILRENLVTFSETARNTEWFRARSIFGEISQYSICASGYLVISLFGENSKAERKTQIFITLGLLFSVSSLGVISALVIWFGWVLYRFINGDIKLDFKKILIFVIIIFGLYLFMHSSSFQRFSGRLGTSTRNRFEAYYDYAVFFKNSSIVDLFFGRGMDLSYLKTWNPSYTKFLLFFGVAGSSIFVFCVMFMYNRLRYQKNKMILLTYMLFLGFATEVLIGNLLVLYLPFIITNFKIKELETSV